MKTYQSVLLDAIESGATKPEMDARLARELDSRLGRALRSGFWFCEECQASCEREEGEQGQPAHCARCGSPQIGWNPPVVVEDRHYIAPEDLQ